MGRLKGQIASLKVKRGTWQEDISGKGHLERGHLEMLRGQK